VTVDGVRVITALEFRNHRFGGEVLISNVTGSWQHDLILQMERRAPQARYSFRCEAEFRPNSEAAAFRGFISDISLSGCYIETLTPEPAGSHLEITFEFNGAQLKIPGIVRSVHPTMGMGIEFVGVTSEIMQALEGIVKSQAAEASANPD